MSVFGVGDRIRPRNWPGKPPAAGGVISDIRQGQDGGTYVLWDNGEQTITAEKYLAHESEPSMVASKKKKLPTRQYSLIRVRWGEPFPDEVFVYNGKNWLSVNSGAVMRNKDLKAVEFKILWQPKKTTRQDPIIDLY